MTTDTTATIINTAETLEEKLSLAAKMVRISASIMSEAEEDMIDLEVGDCFAYAHLIEDQYDFAYACEHARTDILGGIAERMEAHLKSYIESITDSGIEALKGYMATEKYAAMKESCKQRLAEAGFGDIVDEVETDEQEMLADFTAWKQRHGYC